MPTIPYFDWIAHHAGRRPNQLAIHDLHVGRKFSYADLDRRIDRLAGALAARGIGRGDRVALLAQNGPEYFELQFACGRLRAGLRPVAEQARDRPRPARRRLRASARRGRSRPATGAAHA